MNKPSLDHFFSTLANNQRVSILQLLSSEGPMSVNTICEKTETEQSATSHNLKQLLLCHFVTVSRDGKERIYGINEITVKPLLEQIENHVSKYCVQSCKHNKR